MTLGRVVTRLLATSKRSYCSSGGYKAAVLKEFNTPLAIETVKEKPALKSDQVSALGQPKVSGRLNLCPIPDPSGRQLLQLELCRHKGL